MAEYLNVHPSTITREIQRNGYSRYKCYRPRIAQERAAHRWRCRHLPRRFKEDVRKKVDEMILMDYSPEQIVGVCRKQGIKMVSHENTNGLIRQYIPKSSDFTNITQEFLEEETRIPFSESSVQQVNRAGCKGVCVDCPATDVVITGKRCLFAQYASAQH